MQNGLKKSSEKKKERVVGVLQLMNATGGSGSEHFDQASIAAVQKLAADTSIVLQASKLYAEIVRVSERG